MESIKMSNEYHKKYSIYIDLTRTLKNRIELEMNTYPFENKIEYRVMHRKCHNSLALDGEFVLLKTDSIQEAIEVFNDASELVVKGE